MKAPLLFALALAACVPARAAEPSAPQNRFAASLVPAERFEVGAMLVERHGQGGRPLVLIPGLASGSWVWQDTVREFAPHHAIYVVTLPGFDGRPAVAGRSFEGARKAVLELIESRKLDKPVLVGHSLGGTLAIALAEQRPELVGGIVAIDGLPVFPGTEQMAASQRSESAETIKASIASLNGPAFAAQQQQYMRGIGLVDMEKAGELAKLSARSDPKAVAQYAAEVFVLDLRPGLPSIKVPVLVIAPYFEPDARQIGVTSAMKVEYYKLLMAGTPKVEVLAVSPARHFVMFDQPRQLNDAIGRYLKAL